MNGIARDVALKMANSPSANISKAAQVTQGKIEKLEAVYSAGSVENLLKG
jgi:hypothetical protein